LKNESVRSQFKLQLIEREEDLHRYKNLLNAMAALFFTNHRMKDVTSFFQVWRQAAIQKMQQRQDDDGPDSEARLVESQTKHHRQKNSKPPGIEIDTELAN